MKRDAAFCRPYEPPPLGRCCQSCRRSLAWRCPLAEGTSELWRHGTAHNRAHAAGPRTAAPAPASGQRAPKGLVRPGAVRESRHTAAVATARRRPGDGSVVPRPPQPHRRARAGPLPGNATSRRIAALRGTTGAASGQAELFEATAKHQRRASGGGRRGRGPGATVVLDPHNAGFASGAGGGKDGWMRLWKEQVLQRVRQSDTDTGPGRRSPGSASRPTSRAGRETAAVSARKIVDSRMVPGSECVPVFGGAGATVHRPTCALRTTCDARDARGARCLHPTNAAGCNPHSPIAGLSCSRLAGLPSGSTARRPA